MAIVDAAGVPLTLQRLDGTRLHTAEAATLKARTAAITRMPTAQLQSAVHDNPALLSFPGRMPLTGGVPLVHAGEVVGGIGSSGGEPSENEAICQAGCAPSPRSLRLEARRGEVCRTSRACTLE